MSYIHKKIIDSKKIRTVPLFFVFTIVFLINSCATSPTGRSQFMIISPESAIAKSKTAYIQALSPLAKKGKIDNDPATTKMVRQITGRIIAQAIELHPHTRDWEWSIKVIDDPETVNAWCMAGGKMAIYTGIIQKTNATKDEIAQVMAHEVSHALANHTAEKISIAMASQGTGLLLGMGAAVALDDKKNAGKYLAGASALAAVGITLPHSRTAEIEADRMGIELAARAGYDPRAAATLWQKMGRIGGKTPPQFLSTHPSPGNREQTLRLLAQQMMPYYLEKKVRPVYRFKNDPLPY